MTEKLTITKDGKLIKTDRNYNNDPSIPENKRTTYTQKDITDIAFRYLFDECCLEDGVTLKSIFLLLNKNLDIFDSILGNWCKEIVTEGLSQPETVYTNIYDPDGMEYLELYWDLRKTPIWNEADSKFESNNVILTGSKRPLFHAVGYELKEDLYSSWDVNKHHIEQKKGSRIIWSLSFQKSNHIINIPLKLKKEVSLMDESNFYNDHTKDVTQLVYFNDSDYTLGDILNGIIWELSFFGCPEKRDNKGSELNLIVKDLKDIKNNFNNFPENDE